VICRIATHCTEADVSIQHFGLARELGLETVGFLMMAHTIPPEALAKQARIMADAGCQCVYVVDSAGALVLDGVRDRVAVLVAELGADAQVGFHGHENLGLGVANYKRHEIAEFGEEPANHDHHHNHNTVARRSWPHTGWVPAGDPFPRDILRYPCGRPQVTMTAASLWRSSMAWLGVASDRFAGEPAARRLYREDIRRLTPRDGRRAMPSDGRQPMTLNERHLTERPRTGEARDRAPKRIHHRRSAGGQRVGLGSLEVVGEQRLGEVEVAVEGLPVRVQQQLARIAAMTGRRIPRAIHPEAVALAGGDSR
jgi:HMGL-like